MRQFLLPRECEPLRQRVDQLAEAQAAHNCLEVSTNHVSHDSSPSLMLCLMHDRAKSEAGRKKRPAWITRAGSGSGAGGAASLSIRSRRNTSNMSAAIATTHVSSTR